MTSNGPHIAVPYARLVATIAFVSLMLVTVLTLRLDAVTTAWMSLTILLGSTSIVRIVRHAKRLEATDIGSVNRDTNTRS